MSVSLDSSVGRMYLKREHTQSAYSGRRFNHIERANVEKGVVQRILAHVQRAEIPHCIME